MTRIRAVLAVGMALAVAASLASCAPAAPDAPLIAISAPGKGNDAWGIGIVEMQRSFEESGYRVEVRRAGDDIPTQLLQLDDLIQKRPAALVVSPIDGTSLGGRLDAANAVGVPVVAYDRVAYNAVGVDYFVGFDHEQAGRQQAWSLLHGFGLTDDLGQPVPDAPAGPFAIELLAADLEDFAAEPMFDGAMQVLRPFLKAGTLVIPSDITEVQYASPSRGEPTAAAERIRDELAKGVHLDGILSPDDAMSLAIIAELPTTAPAASPAPHPSSTGAPVVETVPPTLVTGCGARAKSIDAIAEGRQLSTLAEDPRTLATSVAEVVDAIVAGTESSLDGIEGITYGDQLIPTRLLAPLPIDAGYAGAPAEPNPCIRPGIAR